jgi:hypothetical protein
MEFEDGLSISILWKTGQLITKIYSWEIVKFLKKSNVFKRRPPTLFHRPRFSYSGA